MKERKPVTKIVEELVDRGTAAVGEVHKEISHLPFDAAERLEPIAQPARKAREINDEVVDVIYGAVRKINHAVWEAAGSMLGRNRRRPSEKDEQAPKSKEASASGRRAHASAH